MRKIVQLQDSSNACIRRTILVANFCPDILRAICAQSQEVYRVVHLVEDNLLLTLK